MARASTTRADMITGAARLLSRRGLQATSFSEVLAATGAPRGSLYHHFPGGKDELVSEATRYVGSQLLEVLARARPSTPEEVVDLFTSVWRRVLTGSDLEAGCAVAAVTIDAGDDQGELLALAGQVFTEWEGALAGLLRQTGVEARRAADLAILLLVAMEGSLVLCRAQRSLEPFDRVTDQLLRAVGTT
jgi:AcrR family transcriptional regulator